MATQVETQAPVDQQVPLAAQIPLSSFTLPTFPPAASHLRALTLTSDINLNDYQDKHLKLGTFEPSNTIPSSITHLTLELFSLGFPAPFLQELAKSLPNLQSLTLFSCLIDGVSDSSRKDALRFFKAIAPNLKDLHIVDTFARVGFWKEVGEALSSAQTSSSKDPDAGLKVLEVSYTYRGHYESDFLNRVGGEEWAYAICPSLVGLSLNFNRPAEDDAEAKMQAEKPEDQEDLNTQDAILPFATDGRASVAIRRRFELLSGRKAGQLPNLKVLNLSMFAMKPAELGETVYSCTNEDGSGGLVGLTASVLLEDEWIKTLAEGLTHKGAGSAIESLEIVGVPLAKDEDVAASDVEKQLMKSEEGVKAIAAACPKLDRLEMTVLKSKRIGNVMWQKEGGTWKMRRDTPAG